MLILVTGRVVSAILGGIKRSVIFVGVRVQPSGFVFQSIAVALFAVNKRGCVKSRPRSRLVSSMKPMHIQRMGLQWWLFSERGEGFNLLSPRSYG